MFQVLVMIAVIDHIKLNWFDISQIFGHFSCRSSILLTYAILFNQGFEMGVDCFMVMDNLLKQFRWCFTILRNFFSLYFE